MPSTPTILTLTSAACNAAMDLDRNDFSLMLFLYFQGTLIRIAANVSLKQSTFEECLEV